MCGTPVGGEPSGSRPSPTSRLCRRNRSSTCGWCVTEAGVVCVCEGDTRNPNSTRPQLATSSALCKRPEPRWEAAANRGRGGEGRPSRVSSHLLGSAELCRVGEEVAHAARRRLDVVPVVEVGENGHEDLRAESRGGGGRDSSGEQGARARSRSQMHHHTSSSSRAAGGRRHGTGRAPLPQQTPPEPPPGSRIGR
jgi:hypothetical protein